jgi:hypothetical protein
MPNQIIRAPHTPQPNNQTPRPAIKIRGTPHQWFAACQCCGAAWASSQWPHVLGLALRHLNAGPIRRAIDAAALYPGPLITQAGLTRPIHPPQTQPPTTTPNHTCIAPWTHHSSP